MISWMQVFEEEVDGSLDLVIHWSSGATTRCAASVIYNLYDTPEEFIIALLITASQGAIA
jgi:hypothetical protein